MNARLWAPAHAPIIVAMFAVHAPWLLVIAATSCAATPSSPRTSSTPSPSQTPSQSPSPSQTPTPSLAPFPMKRPTATEYAAQLTDAGLDPTSLPAFKNLTPDQLRKVMPLFAKSLGVKCAACHDFDKPGRTPRMNVAANMWDHFARQLDVEGGVFCDSCHHGSLQVLDRTDPHALRAWMDESFVKTLGASGCSQCHGDPFRGRFVSDWTAGPPAKR
jgi:hypothetical protein